jgi:hypothetical protein
MDVSYLHRADSAALDSSQSHDYSCPLDSLVGHRVEDDIDDDDDNCCCSLLLDLLVVVAAVVVVLAVVDH